MQKLLISSVCGATLALSACSTVDRIGAAIPDALARTPLMYRVDIQQGNVVTQEMVSQLHPGMTKSQVRFLMGTPMIVDPFHQERWDYVYTLRKGNGKKSRQQVSVFFENEKLARITGDLKPEAADDAKTPPKEQVVEVPDYKGSDKGLITRALEKVGLEGDGHPPAPKAKPAAESAPAPEATPAPESKPAADSAPAPVPEAKPAAESAPATEATPAPEPEPATDSAPASR